MFKILLVTVVAVPLPLAIVNVITPSFFRMCISIVVCVIVVFISTFWLGFTQGERQVLLGYIKKRFKH